MKKYDLGLSGDTYHFFAGKSSFIQYWLKLGLLFTCGILVLLSAGIVGLLLVVSSPVLAFFAEVVEKPEEDEGEDCCNSCQEGYCEEENCV